MSEILVDCLPLEVVDTILLFLSENALTAFYEGLPESSVLR